MVPAASLGFASFLVGRWVESPNLELTFLAQHHPLRCACQVTDSTAGRGFPRGSLVGSRISKQNSSWRINRRRATTQLMAVHKLFPGEKMGYAPQVHSTPRRRPQASRKMIMFCLQLVYTQIFLSKLPRT